MITGHSGVRRMVHRISEELRSTVEIARFTSWQRAAETLIAKIDIQIMNWNGFKESSAARRRLVHKHETLIKYFEKRYADFYRNYDYGVSLPAGDPELEGKIWVCWWQGLNSAPLLVQRCVESIRRNAGDREVIVITYDNFEQYVHIPEWVKAKQKSGTITSTNFSDLLRLSLLAEHGGLWLDSTFYCSGPFENTVFSNKSLWSIKRPDYLHCSVAQGYFAGYSLACDTEHRWIFRVIRDFFLEYWKTNDFMIDYLLVDYMIVLAQKHNMEITRAFAAIAPNNHRCDDLCKILNSSFSEQQWSSLTRDTTLFKLTWKQSFRMKKHGHPTFYAKLISDGLS